MPDCLRLEFEALDVGRQKIDQQDQADEPAAREDGNFPVAAPGRPINEKAAEELRLRGVKPQMDLGQRADEDENQRRDQARPQSNATR